jgi:hypothetical protein
MNSKRTWSEVFQALKENNFRPRILYPAKILLDIKGGIKIFHGIQHKTTNYHYRRF